MAERINFKTSSEKTGELITGFYYRHPISSADVNSLQKNIINNIAGANATINTGDNHLEPYISLITDPLSPLTASEDFLIKKKRKVYSLTGSVYNPFTKSYFTITSENADIQYILPPRLNRSPVNKLYFYYRPITYICSMSHTASVYEPVEGEIVSEHIPAGGFIYTNSVEGSQQYVNNDIFDNDMDMEVSVRYGVEWALSWETQETTLLSQGFIKTQTYLALNIRVLPNKIKEWVFANIVLENPIRWKTLPSYNVLQARAIMMLAKGERDESGALLSDKNIWIIEGLPLNVKEQYLHSINIIFESKPRTGAEAFSFSSSDSLFYDGTTGELIKFFVIDLENKDITDNYHVIPYQALTFLKDRNDFTLYDRSTEAYKRVRYRGFTSNGHIDTSKLNEAWIKYKFNYDTGKFEIPDRSVYNFSGVDHYYDADAKTWKTVIPAGVIRASVAQSKIFEYNEQTDTITTKNNEHRVPPGFLPCDPRNHDFSRNLCSELFKVIGNTYGSDDNDGIHYNPPEFGEVFLRGEKPTTSLSETVKGSDKYNLSITIEENNLPTNSRSLIGEQTNPRTKDASFIDPIIKKDTGTLKIEGYSKVYETAGNAHFHFSGVACQSTYTGPSGPGATITSNSATNPVISSNIKVSEAEDKTPWPIKTGATDLKTYWFPNKPENTQKFEAYGWGYQTAGVPNNTSTGSGGLVGGNSSLSEPKGVMGITSCAMTHNAGGSLVNGMNAFIDMKENLTYTPPVVDKDKLKHSHELNPVLVKTLKEFKLNSTGSQEEISRNIGTLPRYMGVYYYICMGQSLVVDWYNKE